MKISFTARVLFAACALWTTATAAQAPNQAQWDRAIEKFGFTDRKSARPHSPAVRAQIPSPARWEGAIEKFEIADRRSPKPQGAVLFVGSSSFTTWRDIKKYFPDDQVINRGFGGSTIPDVNYFFDRIVTPYRPRLIVMYCGGNDMALYGQTPGEVLASFKTFIHKVRTEFPDVPIIYISLHWPPGRPNQRDNILAANALLRAEANALANVTYLDLYDEMLGPDGSPNRALYKDHLHPGPKGYAIWARKLLPFIESTRVGPPRADSSMSPTRRNAGEVSGPR